MSSGKKKRQPSLLARLFGKVDSHKSKVSRPADRNNTQRKLARKPIGDSAAEEQPAPAGRHSQVPLNARERSMAEIRQMANIGLRDPGRLAQLLTAMLAKEKARQQADRERFDEQVREIVRRDQTQGGHQQ